MRSVSLALCVLLAAPAAAFIASMPAIGLRSAPARTAQPHLTPAIKVAQPQRIGVSITMAESTLSKPEVRGVVTVAGGMMAHFILGTMYCWGNFITYAPQSLMFFDGLAHAGMTPDAVQVMPFGLMSLTLGMPFGARVNKKLGPRATNTIGCALMVLGVFLGSFQTRLLPFMLCYSVLSGFGTGMSYSTPMLASWTWFPNKKGLINGLTLMGFGAGAFIFNKVGTNLALGGMPWGSMIRQLACIYALVSITGSLLIKAKPAEAARPVECEANEDDEMVATTPPESSAPLGASFMEAMKSKRFWIMWILGLMAFTPGLTMLGLYKRFGLTAGGVIADDRFLSSMGGLAAIFNGAGRVFWGNLFDKIGFFNAYVATSCLTICTMLAMPFTINSKLAFATAISGSLFCLGGAIAMFVTTNAQIFGIRNAGEIYSVAFGAFAVASIVGAKLVMGLLPTLGWGGIFKLLAGMGCAAVALTKLLEEVKKKPAPWDAAAA